MLRRTVLQGLTASAGMALAPRAVAQSQREGRWLRLETPNFIAYSASAEDRTREELGAVEGFHAFLSKLIPRKQPSELKLPIYLTGSERDFDATAPWAKSNVYGFWESSVEQIRAVSTLHKSAERQRNMPKNVRALDARTVLLHEYAHHYIIANIRVAYPAWYNEGIAEFLSTVDFVDEGMWIGKFTNARAAWLVAPTWLNINTLLTANPGELSDEKNAQFYAQSWLAVHYLFKTPARAAGFDKYIQMLHDGGDPIGSFEPAFGITPQAFDKELRDYKSKPLQAYRVPGFSANLSPDVKVERLPATADDLLMPVSHLRSAPGRKHANGSLNTIRAQHKKLPGDPFTIRARALGEIWYGDLDEARKMLDNLLIAEPQNAETQHLSGLCHLRMAYAAKDPALFVKARTGFTTAHKIDSTRASSLYRYIECGLNESGGVFGDHYADVMLMTYRLAPQVGPYAYGLANALIQQKRFAEAINVLRPFAANSHASAKAKGRVEALMDAAKAEKELKIAWASPAADTDDEDET